MRYIGAPFHDVGFHSLVFTLRTSLYVHVCVCVCFCVCVYEREDWIEIMVYNSPARKTGERALPSGFLFPFARLFVSFSRRSLPRVLPLYAE